MIEFRFRQLTAVQVVRWATAVCFLVVSLIGSGCSGSRHATSANKPVDWHYKIQGMHCNGCAGGIRSELVAVPGVFSAKVRYPEADAQVRVDPTRVNSDRLVKVIQEAGYQATRVP